MNIYTSYPICMLLLYKFKIVCIYTHAYIIYHFILKRIASWVCELKYRILYDIPVSDPAANQYWIVKSQTKTRKTLALALVTTMLALSQQIKPQQLLLYNLCAILARLIITAVLVHWYHETVTWGKQRRSNVSSGSCVHLYK